MTLKFGTEVNVSLTAIPPIEPEDDTVAILVGQVTGRTEGTSNHLFAVNSHDSTSSLDAKLGTGGVREAVKQIASVAAMPVIVSTVADGTISSATLVTAITRLDAYQNRAFPRPDFLSIVGLSSDVDFASLSATATLNALEQACDDLECLGVVGYVKTISDPSDYEADAELWRAATDERGLLQLMVRSVPASADAEDKTLDANYTASKDAIGYILGAMAENDRANSLRFNPSNKPIVSVGDDGLAGVFPVYNLVRHRASSDANAKVRDLQSMCIVRHGSDWKMWGGEVSKSAADKLPNEIGARRVGLHLKGLIEDAIDPFLDTPGTPLRMALAVTAAQNIMDTAITEGLIDEGTARFVGLTPDPVITGGSVAHFEIPFIMAGNVHKIVVDMPLTIV